MSKLVCNLCSFVTFDITLFREHARICHKDDFLLCPLKDCFAQFKRYDSFRKHCERAHHEIEYEQQQPSAEQMIDETMYDDNYEIVTPPMVPCDMSDSTDCCDEVADKDNETTAETDFFDDLNFFAETETSSGYSLQKIQLLLCKNFAKLLLNLSGRHNLTNIAIHDITEGYIALLKKLWESVNLIVKESERTFDDGFASLLDSLNSFLSMHYFKQFCADNFGLLSCKTITLGSENRIVGELQNRKIKKIDHSIYYIPLQSTLQNLASFTNFFDLNYRADHSENVYHDIGNGSAFANYPTSLLNFESLKLLFFFDELEICNPLGSHTKTHKLAVLCFTFANIPPAYRSSLSSIFVYAMIKSEVLLMYGYDVIIKPLIEEINAMSATGLQIIKQNGEKICVKGFIACFAADTLGAHQLLGLKEGVGFSKRKCRNCMATFETLQKCYSLDQLDLRNVNDHLRQCATLDATSSTEFGINRKSSIFELQYFNPFIAMPHDVMHVVLEGALKYFVKLFLEYCICTKKLFTCEILNERIKNFPYGNEDKSNQPSPISLIHLTKGSLRQTAAQTWVLARMLPFYISDFVNTSSEMWDCFILLLKITSIIMSPHIREEQLPHLEQCISFHLQLFRRLFPQKNCIPKQHYLLHISDNIRSLGPPVRYWCMRFEAKHLFFKNLSAITNWKNVPLYMLERYCWQQCMSMSCEKDRFNVHFSEGPIFPPSKLTDDEKSLVNDTFLNKHVACLAWLRCNCFLFKPSCFVLCGSADGLPEFGKICRILRCGPDYYFIIKRYTTNCIEENYHAYSISIKHESFECCNLKAISFHESFWAFETGDKLLISIKYDLSALYLSP